MYSNGKPITGGLTEFSNKCNRHYKLYPKHDLLEWDRSKQSYKFKDLEDWEEQVAKSKRTSTDNAQGNAKKRRTTTGAKDTTKGAEHMATCTKCKTTCPTDRLEDPHCPVCGAMLPNEGLTEDLIEQKKLPKDAAAKDTVAVKKIDAPGKEAVDTVESLAKSIKKLEEMEENEINKGLMAKLEEKKKVLEKNEAMPASHTAKKKGLEELLISKKMAEEHGITVSRNHEAQIKKLQAELAGDGKESRPSLLRTASRTAEVLRKNEERMEKKQAFTLQLQAQWQAANEDEAEFAKILETSSRAYEEAKLRVEESSLGTEGMEEDEELTLEDFEANLKDDSREAAMRRLAKLKRATAKIEKNIKARDAVLPPNGDIDIADLPVRDEEQVDFAFGIQGMATQKDKDDLKVLDSSLLECWPEIGQGQRKLARTSLDIPRISRRKVRRKSKSDDSDNDESGSRRSRSDYGSEKSGAETPTGPTTAAEDEAKE